MGRKNKHEAFKGCDRDKILFDFLVHLERRRVKSKFTGPHATAHTLYRESKLYVPNRSPSERVWLVVRTMLDGRVCDRTWARGLGYETIPQCGSISHAQCEVLDRNKCDDKTLQQLAVCSPEDRVKMLILIEQHGHKDLQVRQALSESVPRGLWYMRPDVPPVADGLDSDIRNAWMGLPISLRMHDVYATLVQCATVLETESTTFTPRDLQDRREENLRSIAASYGPVFALVDHIRQVHQSLGI